MVKLAKESIETQLARILNAYSEEVVEVLDQSAKNVAKETVEELKETSPKRHGKYGGKYAKGWAFRRETTLKGSSYVIYNPKHYRLTHLLEKGHAKVNGGRTRKFPHIQPAEQRAVKGYEQTIRRRLSQ